MSYGPNTTDAIKARYILGRSYLEGRKAGDLPVQAPVKFDLVVNLA